MPPIQIPPELAGFGVREWLRQSEVHLQPWQLVNLVGVPLVAVVYLPAVVEDLKRWAGELMGRRRVRRRRRGGSVGASRDRDGEP